MSRGRRDESRSTVDRAARLAAAGGRVGADRGTLAFRTLIAVIIVAGTFTIGAIWADRQYAHPTVLDSWQNAYAVFDCTTESWLPPLETSGAGNGIRTRGDGIISIEPTDDSAAGANAQLGVLLEHAGAVLTDDRFVQPDGHRLDEAGTFCSGEEAHLQVIRWSAADADEPSEIRTSDLAATRFLGDGQVFAIALAPHGAKLPMPPSAADLPDDAADLVATGPVGG